jgi:3-hydroxy-9,10-secoandrosta-1,3,5(10)-triene-9,17-dione monooxygenase
MTSTTWTEHPVLEELRSQAGWFADHSDEPAAERRLPFETMKRMRSLGLMRLLQPARYGGWEADPRVFLQAMFELSAVCGSSGWVLGVVGVHNYHVGLYDDAVQAEVWGDDPDTWISSSYAPSGTADPVEGGYIVRGRWSFSSGSDHCKWAFVGGMVNAAGGRPEYRHFLLPRADYRVDDVWNVSGLEGTGSNDLVVEDQFVPAYRSMSVADLAQLKCPGRTVNTGPLYSCPWGAIFLNAVCAPLVGMAEAAIGEAVEYHRARIRAGVPMAIPHPATLIRLAEADAELDAARRSLLLNLGEVWGHAVAGEDIPLDIRARSRRDQVLAVSRSLTAVDKAYESAGPRAIANRSRIQRFWRDAHAGAHHVVNLPDVGLSAYGEYLLTDRMTDPLI